MYRGRMIRTFNCGIIFIDEMTLYQLNSQARLSDSTTANNDELVLSQKLFRQESHDQQWTSGNTSFENMYWSLPLRPFCVGLSKLITVSSTEGPGRSCKCC